MSVVIPYDSSNKILYEQAVPDNERKYSITLYLCGIENPSYRNGSFVGYKYTRFSVKVKLKDIDDNESFVYVVQNEDITDVTRWGYYSYYYTPPSNYYISSFIIESIGNGGWGISIGDFIIYRSNTIFETNYDDTYSSEFSEQA